MTESPTPMMRAAQHRFLVIGIIIVVAVGIILALLNESVKEETRFQQKLETQIRSGEIAPVPPGSLNYAPELEEGTNLVDPLNPDPLDPNDAIGALPAPTSPTGSGE